MIEVSVRGATELALSMWRKVAALKDQEVAYKKCSIFLDQWVQHNFKTEGGKVGGWKPFKIGGRMIKRSNKRYLDAKAKLLQDTGQLRKSMTPDYNSKRCWIRSELPYAAPHNYGTSKLPARRILPELSEVREQANKIFDDHIKEALKK